MKDVIYSIPIDDFIDRVNAADTELVKDRSDEYLLDSNLWTDSEHILANACLNLDDARNMGMDTVICAVTDGVSKWYSMKKGANGQRGEDTKLFFAPAMYIPFFTLVKIEDEFKP